MSREKLLFHYCRNPIFGNIIKNKELWMSDIVDSNDYNEVRILLPGIFFAIEEEYKNNPFEFKYFEQEGIDAVKSILTFSEEMIERSYQKGVLTSFTACFCEQGDVLSQWRGYANDGTGCSIGFSLNELKKYCDNTKGLIKLVKVEYLDRKDISRVMSEKAKSVLEYFKTIYDETEAFLYKIKREKPKSDLFFALLGVNIFDYIGTILIDSLRYKYNTFKEEKEWRMFFASITKDKDYLFDDDKVNSALMKKYDKATNYLKDRIRFNVTEKNIIPFCPIDLKRISDNPIKQVIIGPKNSSKIQDMNLFLAQNDFFKTKVYYSKIAYR